MAHRVPVQRRGLRAFRRVPANKGTCYKMSHTPVYGFHGYGLIGVK